MPNVSKKSSKQSAKDSAAAESAAKSATKAARKANKAANRTRFSAAAAARGLGPVATAIAASIIAPDAFPPCRFQDGYDAEPTSCFEPKTIVEIPFSSVSGGIDNLGFGNDEQWLLAFRDPRRGVIIQQHSVVDTQYGFARADGSTTYGFPANTVFDFDSAIYSSGVQVHGPVLLGGAPNGDNYTSGWFPASRTDAIIIPAPGSVPASTLMTIQLWYSDGDGLKMHGNIPATSTAGGAVTWQLSATVPALPANWTGYIMPYFMSHALAVGSTIRLNYQNTSPVFCHRTLGQFETVDGMIDSFRANGLSLLFTNTVAEIQRSGDVAICQIPKSVSWAALIQGGFDALSVRPGSQVLRADNGGQISWKPTAPFDMQFLDVGVSVKDSNYYPIMPVSDYLAICIRIPAVAGRAGKVQVHCNAEGRTSSPWFGLTMEVPGERLASATAMDFVRDYPQIHENPSHIRDAINFLRKNKKGIGAIAGVIGSAIPGLAPLASAVNAVSAQL